MTVLGGAMVLRFSIVDARVDKKTTRVIQGRSAGDHKWLSSKKMVKSKNVNSKFVKCA